MIAETLILIIKYLIDWIGQDWHPFPQYTSNYAHKIIHVIKMFIKYKTEPGVLMYYSIRNSLTNTNYLLYKTQWQ